MKLLIPPPLQLILTVIAMWVVDRAFAHVSVSFPYQKTIAFVLIGVGLAIEVVSLFAFIRAKTTVNPIAPSKASTLVVTGFYEISRNPMYLGMAILLAGIVIGIGNPLNVFLWGGFIWAITMLQIKPEEELLREKFGDDYIAYCLRVRRWI